MLVNAQRMANAESIEVVGVGVGYDKLNLSVYRDWIYCAIPSALPEAIKAFYEHDADASSALAMEALSVGVDEDLATLLEDKTKFFDDLSSDFDRHQTDVLETPSAISKATIDLCFVVDCSGSMKHYQDVVNSQITAICEIIPVEISKAYPGLEVEVRVGIVAYRDFGDQSPCAMVSDFAVTPSAKLSKHLADPRMVPSGGGDLPEDIVAPLEQATKMKWSSKYRFLFLMTDAPGHGPAMTAKLRGVIDKRPDDQHAALTNAIETLVATEVRLMLCHLNVQQTTGMEEVLSNMYAQAVRTVQARAAGDGEEEVSRPSAELSLMRAVMVDPKDVPPTKMPHHYIFCLDESTSMSLPADTTEIQRRWAEIQNMIKAVSASAFSALCLKSGGDGTASLPSITELESAIPNRSQSNPIKIKIEEFSSKYPPNKWQNLVDAFGAFLENARKAVHCFQDYAGDGSSCDLITVIQFGEKARVLHQRGILLSLKPSLAMDWGNGGKTQFAPALQQAVAAMTPTLATHTNHLIFMSDGDNEGSDSAPTASALRSCPAAQLQGNVHAVMFGSKTIPPSLESIAAMGKCKASVALNVSDLADVFTSVVSGRTMSTQVVSTLTAEICKDIVGKIMLDCL